MILHFHPSAKWIVEWRDEETRAKDARARAYSAAERSCQHDFHMRALYTYIAFDVYEDALMTYLALA